MVQSEVAYRLAAKPGNKQYGSPTAKANWWVDLEMAGSVEITELMHLSTLLN